ncbi:hypothetical protein L1049_016686 [Liquidambar formosana]|uniref:Uncharacterized protein n=1 Tax=Liquidambar formosana TaxID=63359 RepID=A0AAP0S098_LIQFO
MDPYQRADNGTIPMMVAMDAASLIIDLESWLRYGSSSSIVAAQRKERQQRAVRHKRIYRLSGGGGRNCDGNSTDPPCTWSHGSMLDYSIGFLKDPWNPKSCREKEKGKATAYILRTELERREKKIDFKNHVIQQLQLLRNEHDHIEDKIHHIKWSLN